jgi:hypothetical protein
MDAAEVPSQVYVLHLPRVAHSAVRDPQLPGVALRRIVLRQGVWFVTIWMDDERLAEHLLLFEPDKCRTGSSGSGAPGSELARSSRRRHTASTNGPPVRIGAQGTVNSAMVVRRIDLTFWRLSGALMPTTSCHNRKAAVRLTRLNGTMPDLDVLLYEVIGPAGCGPEWRLVCSLTHPIEGSISRAARPTFAASGLTTAGIPPVPFAVPARPSRSGAASAAG